MQAIREWVRENPKMTLGLGIIILFIGGAIANAGIESLGTIFVLVGTVVIIVAIVVIRKNKRRPQIKITNVTLKTSAPYEALSYDVEIRVKQVNETIDLLNTSNNVETVISRYDFLIKVIGELIAHEQNLTYTFHPYTPKDMLEAVAANKSRIMSAAVQRAFDDMLSKASELKTEKGFVGRKNKFFDSHYALTSKLPPETCIFIDDLMDDMAANRPVRRCEEFVLPNISVSIK